VVSWSVSWFLGLGTVGTPSTFFGSTSAHSGKFEGDGHSVQIIEGCVRVKTLAHRRSAGDMRTIMRLQKIPRNLQETFILTAVTFLTSACCFLLCFGYIWKVGDRKKFIIPAIVFNGLKSWRSAIYSRRSCVNISLEVFRKDQLSRRVIYSRWFSWM